MTVVFRALLGWFSGGSVLATLASVVLAVCAVTFGLLYRRYLGILGADRRKPTERQVYDSLRSSLAEGNAPARLYAQRLTGFLDRIDRFFGDAGMADRTLFPHAFGLRTRAPLWTAPAFDRCLLLALFYPIFTVFVIWAVSGHVGPAEASLRLNPDLPAWQRAVAALGVGCLLFISWHSRQGRSRKGLLWLIGFLSGFTVAAVSGAGVSAYAAAALATIALWGFDIPGSGTGAVHSAVFLSIMYSVPGIHTGGIVFDLAVVAALCLASLALARLGDLAIKRQWPGAPSSWRAGLVGAGLVG
jgi:hypothetical protein